jgi:hypothetical protein
LRSARVDMGPLQPPAAAATSKERKCLRTHAHAMYLKGESAFLSSWLCV